MDDESTLYATPDLVPARMVNEYVYCPRLAYLEWVQGEFEDSADTVEGRWNHRVVDREGGQAEVASAEAEDSTAPQKAASTERIHARSLWLSASDVGVTARLDLLEGDGQAVTPVDYKKGAAPTSALEVWEADEVQVCAQGLVLRANGYTTTGGVLYYAESKTRVAVPFTDDLIARTRAAVRGLRDLATGGRIPPPLIDSPKCPRCSLAGICLPDETRLLAGATGDEVSEGGVEDDDQVRRLTPARDDALPLYVQRPGATLKKHGEVFEAWFKTEKLGEARIFETSQIALYGAVQVTTQALTEAMDRGIPVTFFSTGGWFRGMAQGLGHKNVELRQAQYRVALDRARACAIAGAMIAGKIRNSRTLLMRNHPNLPTDIAPSLLRLAGQAARVDNLASLFGIEAMAAKQYFGEFDGLLKKRSESENGWRFDFSHRNRRPPRDPVNALLSYAYSLLVKDLTVTAAAVGFDPYLGFLHQPRYGRPSLALDLMEEFRPLIADSVVLNVLNTGALTGRDFIRRGPAVALTTDGRARFLRAYEQRMTTLVTHPIFGYRISYRRVLEVQVRLLGRALSGEIPKYPTFVTR